MLAKTSLLSLIIVLLAICCKQQEKSPFKEYISQLDKIETPISFNSIEFRPLQGDTSYDSTLFEKYKAEYASHVQGVLFETDSMIAIIYLGNGDVITPVLVTYDLNGNKIDSLNLYENATGYNLEKEVYESITIDRDKKIKVVDNIYTWQVDSTKEERMTKEPMSRKEQVYTHLILDNGMIFREKKGE